MVLNLVEGFAAAGHPVDLLAVRADNLEHRDWPAGVRVRDLGVGHTALALGPLTRYLREVRPRGLLCAKDRAIRVAVRARGRSGVDCPLVGRLGTDLSAALSGRGALVRWIRTAPMRRIYRRVDTVVAVSEGVAQDTAAVTGIPSTRIRVVRNPVVTPRLYAMAERPPDHPWFETDADPVVLGAGRLTEQKDFELLVRAFAQVSKTHPARLVIIGEGRLRGELERLADSLGVRASIDLPGHVDNPYAFMSRAAVFVLSSRWEGSPNVLTEALALGTPVVSTDCPSGPRELLDAGRYGELVAMGDIEPMAGAIRRVLDGVTPPGPASQAVRDYTVEASTRGYLAALGLGQLQDDGGRDPKP
jgi:glycosyltransferase involved in cell wall biosynthesis